MGRRDRQLSPLFTWRTAIASKDNGLTATQRHVALTLSLHMSERGDSCFPRVATVADETGLGISTVRSAMRVLSLTGWLDREIRGGAHSNLYRACIPRQLLAGSEGDDPVLRSLTQPPAPGGEPRQLPAGTSPGAGAESVMEDANVGRQQQRTERSASVASYAAASARTEEPSLSSAAAQTGEPPSLLDVVQELARFRTPDIGTVRVVEPLALQLPAAAFHEVVERTLRRKAANDAGLLVSLLKLTVAERRKISIDALSEAIAEADQSTPVRARRDPEAYVRRLVALPAPATLEQVRDFVGQYVDDHAEVERLVDLAEQLLAESPREQLERWIREVSIEVDDLAVVHAQLDEWVDELVGADYVERSTLHELAEEAREPRPVALVDEEAA